MAEGLKITMGELRSIIAGRFTVMADRLSPSPGSMLCQHPEPLSFLRVNLSNDLDSVRILIDQLRLGNEPEVVVAAETGLIVKAIFSDAENAAAVQEVFTERGV